ncbi:hypothetical protein PVAP13_9NG484000 [Panicum virgatum]|uniref:Uncharacterized protein n=1 Tax=Panicum virgatum TaxID=38727 RepID=A0A8T0MXX9_PANVG|nr:hypothetical protein PVAP13_9NG484000 [Panicum virgatum]
MAQARRRAGHPSPSPARAAGLLPAPLLARPGHRHPDGADGGADAGDVADALVLVVVPELDPVPPGLARGDQREDAAAEQHLDDGVPAAAAAGEDAAQALLERGAIEDAEVGGRRRREAAVVLVPGDGQQPEAGVVGVDSTGGRGYGGVGHGLLPAVGRDRHKLRIPAAGHAGGGRQVVRPATPVPEKKLAGQGRQRVVRLERTGRIEGTSMSAGGYRLRLSTRG